MLLKRWRFYIAIILILVTVMIPVINYINGIDTTIFWAYVQSKTVVPYYYTCGIADQFLVENAVTFTTRDRKRLLHQQ